MRATKEQRKGGIAWGFIVAVAGLVTLLLTKGNWHATGETAVSLGLALILGHSLGLYLDRNRHRNRRPDDEA